MAKNIEKEVKESFDAAERIGVVGSPSSTFGLTVDILGTAADKRLVGNMCVFNYSQDGKQHYALGQMVEINMKNVLAEDSTMRSLIRLKGTVEPITGRQDYHFARMTVSSVFAISSLAEPSMLGTVPSTGTSIKLMDERILNALLSSIEGSPFYLGRAYGTDIKLPMWLKHFGRGSNGAGEAYHIGIFGKTGSGKSSMAKMMILGYAKNPEMSIIILDPQGQYARELPQLRGQFETLGRRLRIYHLSDLVLDEGELFDKILARSDFWEGLVRSKDYRINAGKILRDFISRNKFKRTLDNFQNDKRVSIFEFYDKEIFRRIWEDIIRSEEFQTRVYSKSYAMELQTTAEKADWTEYYDRWVKVANLFTWKNRGEKKSIVVKKLVTEVALPDNESRDVIVIDLSKEGAPENVLWDDEIQALVIKRFLDKINETAEGFYKQDKLLNSLIVIDEAHRFAPRERLEDEALDQVKATLVDAIKTTRKYGLGWMFISQTLSSLDRTIINQTRIYLFGYGLALGIERQALKDIVGGADEAFGLYQLFKDPQSGLGKHEYSFMAVGPISPLSFSGLPLFFTALDFPEEFLKINTNPIEEDEE